MCEGGSESVCLRKRQTGEAARRPAGAQAAHSAHKPSAAPTCGARSASSCVLGGLRGAQQRRRQCRRRSQSGGAAALCHCVLLALLLAVAAAAAPGHHAHTNEPRSSHLHRRMTLTLTPSSGVGARTSAMAPSPPPPAAAVAPPGAAGAARSVPSPPRVGVALGPRRGRSTLLLCSACAQRSRSAAARSVPASRTVQQWRRSAASGAAHAATAAASAMLRPKMRCLLALQEASPCENA